MRKFLIAINLLVLVLLISSCGDIINPEPDVHKTKIKHHIILNDQEHSVIMPLKIGNMWVYKVSGVSSDGTTEFIGYDTILVKRDTIIKSEKWFIAKDPSSNGTEVILTNTDVGLLCNPECFCGILRAEYPAKYSSYLLYTSDWPTYIRVFNNQGELIDQNIIFVMVHAWIDVEMINEYTIFNKSVDCYKYQMRAEFDKEGQTFNVPVYEPTLEYFVPDLGLVRKDFCRIENETNLRIYKRMELVYTNVKM
ncbi:MAG: hypothetical protein WCR42_04950 [bacterium]